MTRQIWRWLTTSRHERWLEEEAARLRAERDECRRQNWALINSLVTTAGAPLPQDLLAASVRQGEVSRRGGTEAAGQQVIRGKKTWHQRAVALEIESRHELKPPTPAVAGYGAPSEFVRGRGASPPRDGESGKGGPSEATRRAGFPLSRD